MTRIGFIRSVVEQNGGRVGEHYANGPGSFGGYSLQGPNSKKVIYKVGVWKGFNNTESEIDNNAIIDQLVGNNGIERAYHSGGYLRVVFSERA